MKKICPSEDVADEHKKQAEETNPRGVWLLMDESKKKTKKRKQQATEEQTQDKTKTPSRKPRQFVVQSHSYRMDSFYVLLLVCPVPFICCPSAVSVPCFQQNSSTPGGVVASLSCPPWGSCCYGRYTITRYVSVHTMNIQNFVGHDDFCVPSLKRPT